MHVGGGGALPDSFAVGAGFKIAASAAAPLTALGSAPPAAPFRPDRDDGGVLTTTAFGGWDATPRMSRSRSSAVAAARERRMLGIVVELPGYVVPALGSAATLGAPTPRDVAKRSSGVTRAGAASRAGGRSTSASSSKSCRGAI